MIPFFMIHLGMGIMGDATAMLAALEKYLACTPGLLTTAMIP